MNRKNIKYMEPGKDVEFLERMASVTEELEDLVQITKGRRGFESPVISKNELIEIFSKYRKPTMGISKSLLGIFRLLVVKNLMRGRLFVTSYNSGKEVGASVTARSKSDFIKAARRLGLGDLEVIRFEPNNIKIRLYGGMTSRGIKQSHRPICFFEGGILSGILENIFRKRMNVREVKCRAMDEPYCQFELTKAEFPGEGSGMLYPIDIYAQQNLKLLTSLASHAITAIENAIMFEKARQEVVVDPLTQVYNRRYLLTRIRTEYRRAQRYNMPLTFFMIDIDNFKKLNDRYGHPVGDTILKIVASRFVENLRDVDIIARYGGDEFSIILPQTSEYGAAIVAERLMKAVSKKKISLKIRNISVTISLGGITLEKKSLKGSFSNMVALADKALLSAKAKGKDNAVLVKKD